MGTALHRQHGGRSEWGVLTALVQVQRDSGRQHALNEQCPVIEVDRRQLGQRQRLLDVMDARCRIRIARGRRLGCIVTRRLHRGDVIGLAPAGEGIGNVFAKGKTRQLLHRASTRRADNRGEARRMNPDLFMAVAVDIDRFVCEPFIAPELRLGQREISPDLGAKEWQVQPAEHAMPVGIIALRPADGASWTRRVSTKPA
jgi:hypothetical protein